MSSITTPHTPFRVKVTRYFEEVIGGKVSRIWNGWFISQVYAMTHDRFLVYDPGDGDQGASEGFCWVDFTEMMPDISKKYWEEESYLPTVELIEE